MPIEEAIVLAGGRGLRLGHLTHEIPKAMIRVAGKPLLMWILQWLKNNGIDRVTIGIAYKGESIREYFKDGASLGMRIRYSKHTLEGGTAEGFRLAIERHAKDETFIAMNGDVFADVKLQELGRFHQEQKAMGTLVVAPMPSPFGVVDVEGGKVRAFHEKPRIDAVHVSIGVYVFRRQILEYFPRSGDIERTVFPRLAKEQKLSAYNHDGFWRAVDSEYDLAEVQEELQSLWFPPTVETRYDVAISFAGEDRWCAEKLARCLRSHKVKVFYDRYEKATLWGKNLHDHLMWVYRDAARYCVMFLSERYAEQVWTNHERRAAQARAFEEENEYILPVRLDDTRIPGILDTIDYVDLHDSSIKEVCALVMKKLAALPPHV